MLLSDRGVEWGLGSATGRTYPAVEVQYRLAGSSSGRDRADAEVAPRLVASG